MKMFNSVAVGSLKALINRIYDRKEGHWSERIDHSHVDNKMLNKRDISAAYCQHDIVHIGKKYGILAQLYHEHIFMNSYTYQSTKIYLCIMPEKECLSGYY